MGVVKFWRNQPPIDAPSTVTAEVTPPTRPVSLDALVSDIRHCRSRVVQLECELAKAQQAEEDAKTNFVSAIHRLDEELGAFRVVRDGNRDE